jgi:hypothetical protein
LHASLPNERTVFATLLIPIVNHLEVAMFCIHFLNTTLLLIALKKIADRFLNNSWWSWLAVFTSILLLNDKSIGNVDLYGSAVQAGDLACMLIAWCLLFFLERKFILSVVVMSIATFIHVLEGLDVMLVLSALLLLELLLDKSISSKKAVVFFSIYAFTAGVYLVFILKAKSVVNPNLSPAEMYAILIEFRHPHHFLFSYYPLFNKLLVSFLAVIALFFFRKRSAMLFRFTLISIVAIVFYFLASNVFHSIFITNFQLYKLAQWVKFFGIMAVFALIVPFFFSFLKSIFEFVKPFIKPLLVLGIVAVWSLVFMTISKPLFPVEYQLGSAYHHDPMIQICETIKEKTPKDALFVLPFYNTEFKFFAQRSAYVEFKANVRNQLYIQEWYRRIKFLYGVGVEDAEKGFSLQYKANYNYYGVVNLLPELKKAGVTHLLLPFSSDKAALELIAFNANYFVYRIR